MLAGCRVANKDATKREANEKKEGTEIIIQIGSQEGVSKVRPKSSTDKI